MFIGQVRIFTTLYRTRSRKLYLANKESTRALIMERIAHFNQHYQVPIARVAIKNLKSRWGSCSRKGNLNFNYKLTFLPPDLRDYVIVHELCHLKEFNHGPKFWARVAETVPNYKELVVRLRTIHKEWGIF
ncbi:MAG TPA: M48 family metallopeptidase [Candidatus Paceibacterota bacterium]